ncbi:hypothetical protein GCM10023172_14990 [Hymenobacter ginsengisoli]|uniref:XRE family transcriptional regulator n=1 Tax=Hymenobacter ginsengisoli TaxID=1051626 RepID=A0ABP8Q7Z2_9BACT|nr:MULTISPECIES: hypothetical protein [unclassified Hymenobacter]MBO2030951.1 hypothetical protein [Hymenobacter sp. BT559]
MQTPIIATDADCDAAIARMIELERGPNPRNNVELQTLADAVEAYEVAAGHVPPGPETPEGIQAVANFIARLRARE